MNEIGSNLMFAIGTICVSLVICVFFVTGYLSDKNDKQDKE